MSLSQYRSMDEEHNIGSFLTLREALRTMSHQEESDITLPVGGTFNRSNRGISRGTIVMVASLSSKGGAQGAAHYVAAKHAVEGLVQTAGKSAFPGTQYDHQANMSKLWRTPAPESESTPSPLVTSTTR